jgi:hypothetical protein
LPRASLKWRKSISGSISNAPQDFLRLGFLATQTNTSIQTLIASQQAFKQIGASPQEAVSILAAVNNKMRSLNDGNLEAQKKFGISRNKITKEINIDFAKAQVELQKEVAKNGEAVVGLWAEQVGMTADDAKLIENNGKQLEEAKQRAQRTLEGFGVNKEMVDTQSRYATAINDSYFGINAAWLTLSTSLERPLTPAIEGFNTWLDDHAPTIKKSLDDIGTAFDNDVISPLLAMGPATDGLASDDEKIKSFKDSVVGGLDGIKELLDTVKAVFEEVDAFSKASQEWARWSGGIVPGVRSSIDPSRGAGGPGTIDFDAPIVSTPLGRALYAASPWDDPGTLQPPPPDPDAARRARRDTSGESWWKPWTWGMGPKEADLPSKDATPKALEDSGGGGFRIPGSDKSADFGDQAVALKSGGTIVQSGNPLPVRIEKIDPAAGGIGGGGGGGQGGADDAPGAHGHWGGAARGRGFHNDAPELSSDTGQPILDEISKSEGTRL